MDQIRILSRKLDLADADTEPRFDCSPLRYVDYDPARDAIRTARVGYVWALAKRETTGSAAAPAARCRNRLR